MKKALKITGISLLSLFILIAVIAKISGITPISLNVHPAVYQTSGVALAGYDPVSYFQNGPAEGSPTISTEWGGVNWYFSSETNKSLFLAAPENYLPQFGGYCSKAVSTGFTAPVDPNQWAIFNDRLYLFSSEEVKVDFDKDPHAIINACKKNWH
jgi:YHS domain-containing protein